MQKQWNQPVLETLDLSMTLAGPGLRYLDQNYQDEDEQGALHHS
ncbi:paeninodin family lasso peptide [Paenibacillus pectinilyticus]|nr:paeninodin family lasso peptide [Paenibacillus pectinilyticus]